VVLRVVVLILLCGSWDFFFTCLGRTCIVFRMCLVAGEKSRKIWHFCYFLMLFGLYINMFWSSLSVLLNDKPPSQIVFPYFPHNFSRQPNRHKGIKPNPRGQIRKLGYYWNKGDNNLIHTQVGKGVYTKLAVSSFTSFQSNSTAQIRGVWETLCSFFKATTNTHSLLSLALAIINSRRSLSLSLSLSLSICMNVCKRSYMCRTVYMVLRVDRSVG
jgi:hypothetical protein